VLERYHVRDDPSWRQRPNVSYLPPHEQERLIDDVRTSWDEVEGWLAKSPMTRGEG